MEPEVPVVPRGHTFASKKYTHDMISPKASLKDLQRRRLDMFSHMGSPKSKLLEDKKIGIAAQVATPTEQALFRGFFKKEARVDYHRESTIIGASPKT